MVNYFIKRFFVVSIGFIVFAGILISTLIFSIKDSAREMEKIRQVKTPKEIIFHYRGMERKLNEEERLAFLRQMHLKGVFAHHSGPLKQYTVFVDIIVYDTEKHHLSLVPDSDQLGEYWLYRVGKSKNIFQFL